MTTYGRIAVILVGSLQSLAGPALAQNQGIGGLAQAFEAGPDQDEAHPHYRVEVLAFAYNGFDPDEEIFPDEIFEIRLDTRPPETLITPAPRSLEPLAPLAIAPDEQAANPASGVESDSPESPTGSPTEDPAGDLSGDPDAEPAPSNEPMGPADDGTLFSLIHESTVAGEEAVSYGEGDGIRTAYVQRLIASLESLEEQSKVPLVFAPFPESTLLPGLDAASPNPLADTAIDPGATDADEPEPTVATTRPTFRILRADELELRGAFQRLQRDGDYTPLAHGGWVQATYSPDQAVPVDISLLGTVNPVGTVQLHLSRFLHVTVDLVYRVPPVPPGLQPAPDVDGVLSELNLPLRYALRAQRRVRSGEVNYLDHPAIGVLVVVRPQPVEPEDADDSLIPPRGPAA